MNKREFISELSRQINYPEEQCNYINEILESNFFISENSKDKIIEDLTRKLEIDNEEANYIYDVAKRIIHNEIKRKLRHPFGNKRRS